MKASARNHSTGTVKELVKGPISTEVTAFVEFATSEQGRAILTRLGFEGP
jgi:molybdopterin-binding protein